METSSTLSATSMAYIPHDVVLRRQHNGLQPISRLPNELLVIIIHLVLLTLLRDRDPVWSAIWLLQWHNVFHVCQRWYEVGVNASALWAKLKVCSVSVECVRDVLRRSRGRPPDVITWFPQISLSQGGTHSRLTWPMNS